MKRRRLEEAFGGANKDHTTENTPPSERIRMEGLTLGTISRSEKDRARRAPLEERG
jgi:hypothetical protein